MSRSESVLISGWEQVNVNETSGEDGLALLGILVGESQLRIPKFEPEIMLSNMLPLVSVKLEYHAEWCALKYPSIRVYVVVISLLPMPFALNCMMVKGFPSTGWIGEKMW